jgi:hypothetical protein
MDQCKFCREYHHEFQLCDDYIAGVEKGEVEIAEEKIDELWLCGKAEEDAHSFQCLAYLQKPTHGAIKFLVHHVVSFAFYKKMLEHNININHSLCEENKNQKKCIIDLEADKTNLISQIARLKEELNEKRN